MSMTPCGIGYKINVFRSKKQQENIKFNHFVKISVNIWLINIKALPLHYQIIVERLNYKTMDELQNIQLTKEEWDSLRFQIGILEVGRGKYTKFLPHAFTEQGLAMLSGVLNSDIAIDVNISIMRAFVSLRRVAAVVRKGGEHPCPA